MIVTPQLVPAKGVSAGRPAPLSLLVDQLGELDIRIQAGKKAEEQAKPIKRQIVEALNLAPGESRIAEGSLYDCVVGEQQNAREIADMGILFDALGRDVFLEHCSFPLSKVDELLPDAGALLKSERTGPRKFKLVRKLVSKTVAKVRKALKAA